jgi:hypothetical protein
MLAYEISNYEVMDWTYLAYDGGYWWAVVNTLMNIWFF